MAKILLVLKNEIYALISRPSFWFGVLGVPLIGFLIYGGIMLINRSQGADGANPMAELTEVFREEEDNRPMGYVDQAGLIVDYPDQFPVNQLVGYASENAARRDLENDLIGIYYVIPPDYIETGQVRAYSQEYNLINSSQRAQNLFQLLEFNLAGSDMRFYELYRNPLGNPEIVNLTPADAQVREPSGAEEGISFFVPYAIMMLFYVAIMSSSGLLLNSISKEKETRVLEVLMVSASPRQILLGKIVGLGLVGLFQVMVWGISALVLLRLSGQAFSLPEDVQLSPTVLLWGIVFFVLGYLVYAALMAGVGALVPNLREASQATTIVIIPLIIPLFVISALIERPNGPLAVGFSLFPLTSPTTMMLRIAATDVPLWQILLAIALLIIMALLVTRAVAGFFRAQTLLSGQPFKIKRFFLALVGRY